SVAVFYVCDADARVCSTYLRLPILVGPPFLERTARPARSLLFPYTTLFRSTNSNGIPDYLDNMPSGNVLPQVIISPTSYLLECDPGLICAIGPFALAGSSGGAQILDDEVGVTEGLLADEDFEPVGGIFDFVIGDLPIAGESASVVIPQQAPIPANAVYRKFQNGEWMDFLENG